MDQTLAHSTSEIMEVWCIDLGANASFVHAAMESLSAQERLRADQCMIPAARTRYILAHAALRRLLAAKLNRDAEEVVFTSGPHGKPELALPLRHPLRFNLSHSGNLALVAISPVAEVGIDVERVRPMPDAVRLAKRFFTPSACGLERKLCSRPPARALPTAWSVSRFPVMRTQACSLWTVTQQRRSSGRCMTGARLKVILRQRHLNSLACGSRGSRFSHSGLLEADSGQQF
jgi:hypothetical protein